MPLSPAVIVMFRAITSALDATPATRRVVERVDDPRRRVQDHVVVGRPDLADTQVVGLLADLDQAVRLDVDVV